MYILFEGIDTCGKTTQIELLSKKLQDIIITKEPGGTKFGQKIREIVLHEKITSNRAELLLFLSDRAQHYKEIIEPNKDKIILSDRGFLSGIGYAMSNNDKEIDFEYLIELNKFALYNNFPDFIFLFTTNMETLKERIKTKEKTLDKIELRGLEYLIKVQEHMIQTLRKLDISYIFVDATQNIEVIHQTIYNKILELKKGYIT
jgi:dTMP kinase